MLILTTFWLKMGLEIERFGATFRKRKKSRSLRWTGILWHREVPCEFVGERILKIGVHFRKLWPIIKYRAYTYHFFWTRCRTAW